jgi:hypothetical protein
MMEHLAKFFEGYGPHDAMYVIALALVALLLAIGHLRGKINMWDLVTSTDSKDIVRTDPRKMFECGAFVVMTIAFSYLTIVGKMTEFYATIYVGAFVAARTLRDFAQLKDKALEMTKDAVKP